MPNKLPNNRKLACACENCTDDFGGDVFVVDVGKQTWHVCARCLAQFMPDNTPVMQLAKAA